jgi:SH3-like domain-containing protein
MKFFGAFFLFFILLNSQATAICVRVDKANLRAGPSTNTKKTWEVYKFMPFEKVKSHSGWHQVKDVDGDLHWIHSRLVDENLDCATVKVLKANLRTGPGTNHRAVPWGPAQKYYAFKILKREGSWIQVEDAAGGKAWVNRDLVWAPRAGTSVGSR